MRISELIRTLKTAQKKFGDVPVGFDASTLNEQVGEDNQFSEECCVFDVDWAGTYKLRYEDSHRAKKVLVLGIDNDSLLADEQDLLGA